MIQSFPIKDLIRRPFQTGITIITLTLSVASTLFLLFFSSRIGVSLSSTQGTLTLGLTAVFSQFLLFMEVLVFIVGAVLTSFIIFLMFTQRIHDFGLIKASGCPNALVAGYFITELLLVTIAGCVLGIIFGFIFDFTVANLIFQQYYFPNFWFSTIVFTVFFILTLYFGIKPILNAAKMSPIKALSPTIYYGLTSEKRHKPLSRSGITWNISLRSLVRRQSATVRIVILLSTVFILLTVSISGSIIASNTTNSWVMDSVKPNTLIIAHKDLADEYKLLLSSFSGGYKNSSFNFTDPILSISNETINQIEQIDSVEVVDARLILNLQVKEVSNFTIVDGITYSVGDYREGEAIVFGVNPSSLSGYFPLKGQFLNNDSVLEAVIGDSLSHSMYSVDPKKKINFSNPLLQGIRSENNTFRILGVCVDQINNGFTAYIPISELESITGISNPNLILLTLNKDADRTSIINQISNILQSKNPFLDIYSLETDVTNNLNYLSSIWLIILIIPLLTLISTSLCLVGYSNLTIDEQHQEFGILRAIGTKPRLITFIISIQSMIVLLSGLGFGLSLGTIATLMILMANPIVTVLTLLEITLWLFAAVGLMYLFSLYPAIKFGKKPILKMLT